MYHYLIYKSVVVVAYTYTRKRFMLNGIVVYNQKQRNPKRTVVPYSLGRASGADNAISAIVRLRERMSC